MISQRFLEIKQFISPKILWGCLAIVQTVLLIVLFLSWTPVQLSMVVPRSELDHWEKIVAEFEADHAKIKINLIGLENIKGDITGKIKEVCALAIPDRSVCDLIYLDVIWVAELSQSGQLLPLESRLEEQNLQDFSQPDIQAGQYQGHLYWLPLRSDLGLLYYRKDWLDQLGVAPPETFADLTRISQTLQTQEISDWGFLWQGEAYEGLSAVFVEILQGFGGFWLDLEQQEVGLEQPAALEAVQFLRETLGRISPPQVQNYTEAESLTAFLAGDAAFLRHWPAALERIKASPLQSQIGLQPMMLHQPGETGGACRGSWGFSIAKNSRHPEAAWQAISYFTSERGQRRFIVNTGFFPSRLPILQDEDLIAEYPYYEHLPQAIEQAVSRPPLPEYAEVSQILQKFLSLALAGQLSPEAAMEQAASETRQLLGWE
ncbi:MAG: ABC transporter substrate-binding protein [Kamptonema sp. SIO4C4]|nr:ABC transporter substrate-binding protein [Kamptonema sp. SIO4C4]